MKDDNGALRLERDPLGEKRVPADALYAVQTARALENFRISRQRIHPLFITAYAEIKKAAAEANVRTSGLDPTIGDAIVRAADELIAGQHRDQFDLDAFQAGAGTSYNMNLNEVIANRALEILGGSRGDYPAHQRSAPCGRGSAAGRAARRHGGGERREHGTRLRTDGGRAGG